MILDSHKSWKNSSESFSSTPRLAFPKDNTWPNHNMTLLLTKLQTFFSDFTAFYSLCVFSVKFYHMHWDL